MPVRFSHEQTLCLSEQQYLEIHSHSTPRTRLFRSAFLAVAGVLALFWSYTFVLGLLMLAFVALSLFAPRLTSWGARVTHRDMPHLLHELTYGASDEALWVRGEDLDLRTTWKNIRVWDERAGWLYVAPNGMTSLYFRVAALKEAGVYDAILELSTASAPRFNSPRKVPSH